MVIKTTNKTNAKKKTVVKKIKEMKMPRKHTNVDFVYHEDGDYDDVVCMHCGEQSNPDDLETSDKYIRCPNCYYILDL